MMRWWRKMWEKNRKRNGKGEGEIWEREETEEKA